MCANAPSHVRMRLLSGSSNINEIWGQPARKVQLDFPSAAEDLHQSGDLRRRKRRSVGVRLRPLCSVRL